MRKMAHCYTENSISVGLLSHTHCKVQLYSSGMRKAMPNYHCQLLPRVCFADVLFNFFVISVRPVRPYLNIHRTNLHEIFRIGRTT